jgi:hypothetical protein
VLKKNSQWLDKDPNAEEGADTGLDKTPDRRAWKRVSDVIKPIPKLENRDIKLISSIIGVKATNLFVTKMAQIKQVDIKDFLKDFSKYGPQLVTFKPHDFVVINEDIFQYLEANTFSDSDAKTIAKKYSGLYRFLRCAEKERNFCKFCQYVYTRHL